jgi:hypothetical protein
MRVLLLNRVVSASACLIALSSGSCVTAGELEDEELYKAALAGGSSAPVSGKGGGGGAPAGGSTGGAAAGAGGAAATAMGCANACQIMADKCALCHGGPSGMGMGFDVVSPNIGMRFSGVDAKTVACVGEKLIDPVMPDRSVVYTKLLPTDPPRCGQLMPPAGTTAALTPDEIECMRQWVAKPVCP